MLLSSKMLQLASQLIMTDSCTHLSGCSQCLTFGCEGLLANKFLAAFQLAGLLEPRVVNALLLAESVRLCCIQSWVSGLYESKIELLQAALLTQLTQLAAQAHMYTPLTCSKRQASPSICLGQLDTRNR